MAIARVACAVIVRVEIYDEADGADARIRAEEAATQAARANSDKVTPAALNPSAGLLRREHPTGADRPSFVVGPILPLDWKVTYNTFRVADELEFTIPIEALPVPSMAIRVLSVRAVVQQVDADVWGAGLDDDDLARRLFVGAELEGDFEGVGTVVDDDATSLPVRKIKCLDYTGLLAAKQVVVGAKLDRDIPVSQAVRAFLVGSPAEGLEVLWVDPDNPEPELGRGLPKAKKKGPKAKAAASPFSGQKYLDVLVKECGLIGVVLRVSRATIELAHGGTMYEGRDRGGDAKATLLLGTVIETFKTSHTLVGAKIHTVALCCYNPDKGQMMMSRWPPDPKTQKPTVLKPGEPPRLPPIAANIGLPGAAQLDESVLMIAGPPLSDPKIARELVRMIFVERTRQKVKHTLGMHAPWESDEAPAVDQGKLLKLRAGDNVKFGVVDDPDALIRPELRAIVAGADAGATSALLRRQGVRHDVAAKVAEAIACAPVTSRFRVDTMTVAGGKDKAADIDLTIVNFTTVVSDLAAKSEGKTLGDYISAGAKLVEAAVAQTVASTQALFESLFRDLGDSDLDAAEKATAHAELQAKHAQAMKGRQ